MLQANNAVLRTNDQILSLTDQMTLGVRGIELDTHWFEVWFVSMHAIRLSRCKPDMPANHAG